MNKESQRHNEEIIDDVLISIVIPVFNEEDCIFPIRESVGRVFSNINGCCYEIIFVDDGSTDSTLSKLIELKKTESNIKIIELSRNFGKENALTAGIDYASGDAIIIIDADLQDPPELINTFIEKWAQGADMVVGRRLDRSSDSFLKRLSAKLFYKFHNKISYVKMPENVGDFRLMDKSVVLALRGLNENQRFMKGLYSWVGFETVIVDYIRPARTQGVTKFSGWKLWNLALEDITSFSTTPLRMWTYVGLLGSFLSLSYAFFTFIKTIVYGIALPGYASLLIVVLFMGSLQLISVGLLGEYIGRTYMESKRRPSYLVKKAHDEIGHFSVASKRAKLVVNYSVDRK